jgi:hypothetical protein
VIDSDAAAVGDFVVYAAAAVMNDNVGDVDGDGDGDDGDVTASDDNDEVVE